MTARSIARPAANSLEREAVFFSVLFSIVSSVFGGAIRFDLNNESEATGCLEPANVERSDRYRSRRS